MEKCQLKMKITTERIIILKVFLKFLARQSHIKVVKHLTKLDLRTWMSLPKPRTYPFKAVISLKDTIHLILKKASTLDDKHLDLLWQSLRNQARMSYSGLKIKGQLH